MLDHKPLTARESAFIDAYLEGLNATQAYIKAGYSKTGAHANAARLMAKDSIGAELDRRQALNRKRHAKTADDAIRALSHMAFTGMSRFMRVDEVTGEPRIDLSNCTTEDLDLLTEVTVESYVEGRGEDARQVKKIRLKPYSRLDALKVLAQYFGLLNGKEKNDGDDKMASLMKEIMARTSSLPVRVTGPLGSKRPSYLDLVKRPTTVK